VLHQRSDQPAGVPGARGFGRIGAMKRAPPPLQRQPRPPRDLTPPSGVPATPPLCSAGRTQPATSLAAAAHRPLARPGAAAATAGVSTTPVWGPRPRSTRRAAHTRKTNRLAAGPCNADATGPIHSCCPPPPFTLSRHQPQPCLSYQQNTLFSFKIQKTILNFWLIRERCYQF
jgi:hypothetical protein